MYDGAFALISEVKLSGAAFEQRIMTQRDATIKPVMYISLVILQQNMNNDGGMVLLMKTTSKSKTKTRLIH